MGIHIQLSIADFYQEVQSAAEKKMGLVVEGGGTKCAYNTAILDRFLAGFFRSKGKTVKLLVRRIMLLPGASTPTAASL